MSGDFTENLGLDSYRYSSHRMPVMARRGVVATGEPLAAQAGLRVLQDGGNAVDAAVAAAIALTVTEPVSNGLGSDAFALVWDGAKLHGLNGSGRACAAHTPEFFQQLGVSEIPMCGWPAVTVPGAVAAWQDLHARFGRLPLGALFRPAIEYAEQGFPVSPLTAARWASSVRNYPLVSGVTELKGWWDTFTRGGKSPAAGELWSSPDTARTLRTLSEAGADAFYRGELARKLVEFAERTGGRITLADLAAHTSTWVDPISVAYHGHEIWELPPNSNGIVALSALAILDGLDVARYPRESADAYHLQIEAMKLAFADAQGVVADPQHVPVSIEALLEAEHVSARRAQIGDRAAIPRAAAPSRGGTVYVCAADADGMMVSFIQSNYSGPLLGFGSGVVVPGTGIAVATEPATFAACITPPS